MDSEKIINLITSQIPLLIMSINNGTTINTLVPILSVPILIYFVHLLPKLFKYLKNSKIPKNYFHFCVGDDSTLKNYQWIDFMDNLSIFLNKYDPSSIKQGTIESYETAPYNPNILYKCYAATINPSDGYYGKFSFQNKINGKNILESISDSGFIYPENMDLEKLLKYPIYLSCEYKFEKTVSISHQEADAKKVRKYIKISTIDIETAKNFVYIVNNYRFHLNNHNNNMGLNKILYSYNNNINTNKNNYDRIESIVNVKKTYENTFLTQDNENLIIGTISNWNKNKIINMENGIPNKLGFYLVGNPGCGKTSLVYAIAYETKKNIVTINMQDFTNKSFIHIMSSIDNSIVLFDDIDTYKFLHKRINNNLKNKNDEFEEKLLKTFLTNKDNETKISLFSKEMTLDIFLEVLDGYNYLNNCIVILTTNHPELLDPAITRPGRIDHTINFTFCDKYQFKNIFKFFIGYDYTKINKNFIFAENKYTTSHIINTIVLPNKNNPTNILKSLKKNDN